MIIEHKGHEVFYNEYGYIIRGNYINGPTDLRDSVKLKKKSSIFKSKIALKYAKKKIDQAIKIKDNTNGY